ncbi:MAG TPA: response regulator [Kofleriaceae bacterium]
MALRLLIADDNPDDARLVVREVKRAGFIVEWQRVDDEIDFARELPGVDLVICDYSMPKFSPYRALEVIRESRLATPLLLVSGDVPEDSANQIVSLGAVGYVLKDRLDGLGQLVSDALAGTTKPAA